MLIHIRKLFNGFLHITFSSFKCLQKLYTESALNYATWHQRKDIKYSMKHNLLIIYSYFHCRINLQKLETLNVMKILSQMTSWKKEMDRRANPQRLLGIIMMVVGKLSMKEADIFKIWEFANIQFPFPYPLKAESKKIIYFEDIFT